MEAAPISVLSEELVIHLFSFLSVQDLGVTARVCSEWKRFSEDTNIWKDLCRERWQDKQNWKLTRELESKLFENQEEDITWKKLYQRAEEDSKRSFITPEELASNRYISLD